MAHLNFFPYSFQLSPFWDPTKLCCGEVKRVVKMSGSTRKIYCEDCKIPQ